MSERWLHPLPSPITEAPRPHRRRLWYFWPAFIFSGACLGAGAGEWLFGTSRLTGLALIVIGLGLVGSVTWLEGTQ